MIDLVNSGAVVHSEAIHSEAIQPLSTSDAADLPSIVVSPSFVRESNTLGPPQSPTLRAQQSNTLFRPATSSRPNIVEVQSSLGIRRLPSTPQGLRADAQGINSDIPDDDGGTTGRRRSLSAPQWVRRSTMPRKDLRRQTTSGSYLPAVAEGELPQDSTSPQPLALRTTTTRRFRSGSTSARSTKALQRRSSRLAAPAQDEYGAEVVDLLDVVDPEVSTLSTLNNVQNSLFVPDLGKYLNRRPTYDLSRRPADTAEAELPSVPEEKDLTFHKSETAIAQSSPNGYDEQIRPVAMARTRKNSISSVLGDTYFAVLPHGVSISDWSEEDKQELNDLVRHMLHSRRAKFKRSMKGFGQYVRKPLGFFVTLYAFLITTFGLIWVLFLIGWISSGSRQSYDINVIDNVLVALFAVVGDGLAPFRAVDTYHMIFIVHYHHLTWRLRKKQALPRLPDPNDLPRKSSAEIDMEPGMSLIGDVSVLSESQHKRLLHHQKKFSKSHTFYKPHETTTHHAFSIGYLIGIVSLLDSHSLLQIALGTCTWAIDYHTRPQALTTVILCLSICCNITAGILISMGDRLSRKKDVVKRMARQALTKEALAKVKVKKQNTHTKTAMS